MRVISGSSRSKAKTSQIESQGLAIERTTLAVVTRAVCTHLENDLTDDRYL